MPVQSGPAPTVCSQTTFDAAVCWDEEHGGKQSMQQGAEETYVSCSEQETQA